MLSVERSQSLARSSSLRVEGPGRLRSEAPGTLVREVTVERAKSVLAVAHRVDDAEAEQMLLETAADARVPMQVAAEGIMAALAADSNGTATADVLEHALATVREYSPVEPRSHVSTSRPRTAARAA